MDYKTMLAWAEKIKARCEREGLPAQQTRDRIYNAALVMFSDDDDAITPAAVRKAKKIVKAVMPGETSPALIVAITTPENGM